MGMNFYTAGGADGGVRSDDKNEKRQDTGGFTESGQAVWQPGPNYGWIHTELSKDIMDHLWKSIKEGEEADDNYKQRLAGNVSNSLGILDKDNIFQNRVLMPLVQMYRKHNGGSDPVRNFVQMDIDVPLLLTEFWVNYQYPGEFNPYHFHGGAYSFAIWMKIPYDWEIQKDLPQFKGTKIQDRKVGCFEFEYIDMIGGLRNFAYRLSPGFEGQMVFFPASLRHSVYPFFTLPGEEDGCRISIAGNLWYDTTGLGLEGNQNNKNTKILTDEGLQPYSYEEDETLLDNPFANQTKIDIKKKGKKVKKGFGNL